MDHKERETIRREGFTNAAAGDKFYVYSCGYGMSIGTWGPVLTVERVTPTQIVLENGTRLSKKTFSSVSSHAYDRTIYYPAHPEFRAERNRDIHASKVQSKLYKLLERLKTETLSVETKEALVKAIDGILNPSPVVDDKQGSEG